MTRINIRMIYSLLLIIAPIFALLSIVGCGTVTVTSDPPGAMIFDTSFLPSSNKVTEDVLMAGFSPCSYRKEGCIPGAKARWPDGSESQWKQGPRDDIGFKSVTFHFEKSDSIIPKVKTTNWFPVLGSIGYVEFYNGEDYPPEVINIYQTYGTEDCLVGYISPTITQFGAGRNGINSIPNKHGHLRVPCQPGINSFVIKLGTGKTRMNVDVKENELTPIRIDCTRLPASKNGVYQTDGGVLITVPGSQSQVLNFRLDVVVEKQQSIGL